jgi:hypothetical protein
MKKSTYACYKEPKKDIYTDFPYFIIQFSSYMGKLQLGKGYDKTNISSHLSPSGSNTTLKRWQIGSAFEQMFLRSSLSDKTVLFYRPKQKELKGSIRIMQFNLQWSPEILMTCISHLGLQSILNSQLVSKCAYEC